MLNILRQRLHQGQRTIDYPASVPPLPDRLRGLPVVDRERCTSGCTECREACPTQAIRTDDEKWSLDLGRCLFCTDCVDACPDGALGFTPEFRLAASTRHDLHYDGRTQQLATALDRRARRLFGRSLKLRQVSAGGCNGCEADVNVLSTVVFDLGRFGIQMVASPRHADGLLITGPIPENMRLAVEKCYQAVPAPKLVIAVGACAISGGPYLDHAEVLGGADRLLPVDLYIPGCPPHPLTILDGLLRLLGRIEGPERTVPAG